MEWFAISRINVPNIFYMVHTVIIFGLRFAFFTHISGEKTHSFQQRKMFEINTLRMLMHIFESLHLSLRCLSNLQCSNFRVEKCKTEENLLKFLNNMAYKTVTSMRDCSMKRNFM